jgi:hypothetical protein
MGERPPGDLVMQCRGTDKYTGKSEIHFSDNFIE